MTIIPDVSPCHHVHQFVARPAERWPTAAMAARADRRRNRRGNRRQRDELEYVLAALEATGNADRAPNQRGADQRFERVAGADHDAAIGDVSHGEIGERRTDPDCGPERCRRAGLPQAQGPRAATPTSRSRAESRSAAKAWRRRSRSPPARRLAPRTKTAGRKSRVAAPRIPPVNMWSARARSIVACAADFGCGRRGRQA